MASMSMAASFIPATTTKLHPVTTSRRSLVVFAKASVEKRCLESKLHENVKAESNNTGRRDLMFASAAAAAVSVTRVAIADEEPKRGTLEAKKKYAPICVTMPTARICRN